MKRFLFGLEATLVAILVAAGAVGCVYGVVSMFTG